MAGIDLLTGTVHALVKDRHRSREFIEFLKILDTAYPAATAIKVILDNPRRTSRGRPRRGWPLSRTVASRLCSSQNTAPGSTSSRGFLQSSPLRAPPDPCHVHTRVEATHTIEHPILKAQSAPDLRSWELTRETDLMGRVYSACRRPASEANAVRSSRLSSNGTFPRAIGAEDLNAHSKE